jgi:phage tail-like protein
MIERDDSGQAEARAHEQPVDLPAIPRNFSVAIDTAEIGFCSVSRLGSETVSEEPNGDSLGPTKVVHRYANVVLRRALGADRRLYLWRENILTGKTDKRSVTIRQLDAAGRAATHTWTLNGAWPCRWAGPSFDAGATELAMEEIELVFDRLVWR